MVILLNSIVKGVNTVTISISLGKKLRFSKVKYLVAKGREKQDEGHKTQGSFLLGTQLHQF